MRKRGPPGNVPSWSRQVFSKCVSEATRDSRRAALPGWPHHIFSSAVQAGGDPPLGTLDSCDDLVATGVSGLLGPGLQSFRREPRWRSCGQCPDHCRKSTLMPSTRGVTWLWVILSAAGRSPRAGVERPVGCRVEHLMCVIREVWRIERPLAHCWRSVTPGLSRPMRDRDP